MRTPGWDCHSGTVGEWVASRGRRPCISSQAAALHFLPSPAILRAGRLGFPARARHGVSNPLRLLAARQVRYAHSSRWVL